MHIGSRTAIVCIEVIPLKKKKIRKSAVVSLVLIAVLVIASILSPDAVATGSWGLSFHAEGSAPTGSTSQQILDTYDARYIGDTSQPEIVLTFDAGYENGNTSRILDVLKQHDVPAAFFLVGNYLEQNADLVRRMNDEGHTVGNHTYHHRDMSQITDSDAFAKELTAVETLYQSITGEEMAKYYRPPEGLYSEENLKMAQELGYKTVFWSLAYADWDNGNQPTKEAAFSKLIPRIHNGAVVLLHSTSATNAEILDELLTEWKGMGYRFITLDDLFV